jgi:hypothetical protein
MSSQKHLRRELLSSTPALRFTALGPRSIKTLGSRSSKSSWPRSTERPRAGRPRSRLSQRLIATENQARPEMRAPPPAGGRRLQRFQPRIAPEKDKEHMLHTTTLPPLQAAQASRADPGTPKAKHYCRNPRCRMKLPAPVENGHHAFCCRRCHSSFYRSRCLVCEDQMKRKAKRDAESFALVAGTDPKLAARIKQGNSTPHPIGPPLNWPPLTSNAISSDWRPTGNGAGVTDIPDFLPRRPVP